MAMSSSLAIGISCSTFVAFFAFIVIMLWRNNVPPYAAKLARKERAGRKFVASQRLAPWGAASLEDLSARREGSGFRALGWSAHGTIRAVSNPRVALVAFHTYFRAGTTQVVASTSEHLLILRARSEEPRLLRGYLWARAEVHCDDVLLGHWDVTQGMLTDASGNVVGRAARHSTLGAAGLAATSQDYPVTWGDAVVARVRLSLSFFTARAAPGGVVVLEQRPVDDAVAIWLLALAVAEVAYFAVLKRMAR